MLHIEQAKVRSQIAELAAQQAVIETINPQADFKRIGLGSLIKAGENYYFLSTALGKIVVDNVTVIALSMQSPLGSELKGLSAGESLTINGKKLLIDSVE